MFKMTNLPRGNSHSSSPYPARRKKNRLKFSWNQADLNDESVSEQIDDFVADVIEKAKAEYIEECKDKEQGKYIVFSEDRCDCSFILHNICWLVYH